MATLTVSETNRVLGLEEATFMVAAAAGLADEWANTGGDVMIVDNAGASPCNVTFVTPALLDGLAVADLVVTVAAGERRMVGPFPKSVYNHATNKVCNVTYDQVSSVTVGLFKLAS